ncbi:choline transporter protein 1-like isoform X1 [Salvia splendens]|uniref:choline transporter protein 1-like isoform X1 n=1 Tax=Salvia splendens TaxID=180675 RepID=UPI001C267C3E|nr:choline transporter protein 1-like isoform X1 [Salvia splendens]XP_042024686.1 choline transporter protein 1-like isoform X1 [Salvia splendens]
MFIARASNVCLNHWEQMGGVKVIEDIAIDRSIHKSVNSRPSVLKYSWLDTHTYKSAHNKITSPLFPVCWGFGYIVEMSIDTMILSFCQDSDKHQGTAQYVPPLLIETLNDQDEMQRLTQ